jgi:hypothetical protein
VTSKLTAALAQVPAIKKELDMLCTTLAMCKSTKITPEVQAFFHKKLSAVTLCDKKGKKGHPPVVYDLDLWGQNDLSDSLSADKEDNNNNTKYTRS